MLNIAIPMAGLGSRFARAGYLLPKPLIEINGIPMIRLVIENIRPTTPHRFIFICQKDHIHRFGLREHLSRWAPGAVIIGIDGVTEGAACTVLAARELIATDQPLMIANSDQYIDLSIDDYLAEMERRSLDGLIMTMPADDPKWSFAALDARGLVREVAEKTVISRNATVGIYNFRSGQAFVDSADVMILRNERVNGEFYVAPVYNELIASGACVGIYEAGALDDAVFGLGIPADLDRFVHSDLAVRVTEALH